MIELITDPVHIEIVRRTIERLRREAGEKTRLADLLESRLPVPSTKTVYVEWNQTHAAELMGMGAKPYAWITGWAVSPRDGQPFSRENLEHSLTKNIPPNFDGPLFIDRENEEQQIVFRKDEGWIRELAVREDIIEIVQEHQPNALIGDYNTVAHFREDRKGWKYPTGDFVNYLGSLGFVCPVAYRATPESTDEEDLELFEIAARVGRSRRIPVIGIIGDRYYGAGPHKFRPVPFAELDEWARKLAPHCDGLMVWNEDEWYYQVAVEDQVPGFEYVAMRFEEELDGAPFSVYYRDRMLAIVNTLLEAMA